MHAGRSLKLRGVGQCHGSEDMTAELCIDFNKENDPNDRCGAHVYTLSLDHLIAGHLTEDWGYANFISYDLMYYNRYQGTKYLSDNDKIVLRVSKIEVSSMK